MTGDRAVRFAPARELPQLCLRCGAVATHYLTCPSRILYVYDHVNCSAHWS